MKRFSLFFALLFTTISLCAQVFNEYDRKVFNEGQVLTNQDLKFADDVKWDDNDPISVYCIHNEGDETILTFSHSIYFDSQWVRFGKGLKIVDCATGDEYHVRGYAHEGLSMDNLLIVKGCNGKNILVSLRFPKLKRKVKYIDVYSVNHKDDIKPSNRREGKKCLGSNLSVKKLRNMHKGKNVYK